MLDQLKKAAKRFLSQEIATRHSDPNFYSALNYLPNPDPILRKMGKSEEVYDAIYYDAHVLGELRSIRSGLLAQEWRLQPGGDRPADLEALELCQKVFSRAPAPDMLWPDVIWNIAKSVFTGYQAHEVVWQRYDRFLLPERILDKPNRRFIFSPDNELRLLTKENRVQGIALDAYKWLLTRHMPSYDNPYGVALFSACFWPYTFKHSGFRYFVKFCEKYGIPWAIGRYPEGTPKAQQDALADALAQMIEDAVAAIPDGGKVELIEARAGGEMVQERLIHVCNGEMSKALTSQTLATEINGQGSRAAAETHRDRETSVNDSDRFIIEETLNTLLAWITEINFTDAAPPRFEFYDEAEARNDWVKVLDGARRYIDIPVQFAHERLQIPMPEPGEEVLPREAQASPFQFAGRNPGFDFRADRTIDTSPVDSQTDILTKAADAAGKRMLDTVRALVDSADSLEQLRDDLLQAFADLDESSMVDIMAMAFAAANLSGRYDVAEGE